MDKQWKRGDSITIGHYPQSSADTYEPIEWIIIKIDKEQAFLTSLYALDAQPYHGSENLIGIELIMKKSSEKTTLRNMVSQDLRQVTWETSTLRTWLNQSFMNIAFSKEEQNCLLEIDALKDKVSLLKLDENINDAEQFPSDASTGCRATAYAANHYVDDIEAERQARASKPLPPRATYWLQNKGVVVHGDRMEGVLGVICPVMELNSKLAIRPMLLLDLNRYEQLVDLSM